MSLLWVGISALLASFASATGCLPNAIPADRRIQPVDGQPVKMARYSWENSGITGYVAKIILEEHLGMRTIQTGRFGGSWRGPRAIAGWIGPDGSHKVCVPGSRKDYAGCDVNNVTAHYIFDSWGGGRKEYDELPAAIQPVMQPMGYAGFEGTFLPGEGIRRGLNETPPRYLNFYMTLNASDVNASNYFASWAETEAAIQANSFTKAACTPAELPQAHAGCTYYEKFTGDMGMFDWNGGSCTLKCDKDWILSPACRAKPSACVAWISTGDGWGVEEMMQQASHWNIALAIVVLPKWGEYTTLPKLLPSLYFWFFPDTAFHTATGQPPVRLVEPLTDEVERRKRLYKTGAASITMRKFIWRHLERHSRRANFFLRNVFFSNEVARWMMDHMVLPNAKEKEVACDWVRRNKATWMTWVPLPTTCDNGWGISDSNGKFVSDVASASQCSRCVQGRYSEVFNGTYVCQLYIDCDSWRGFKAANEARTRCDWEVIQFAWVGALLVFLLWLIHKVLQFRRRIKDDSPDRKETEIGSWVLEWIGPFRQACLEAEFDTIDSSDTVNRNMSSRFGAAFSGRSKKHGRKKWCKCACRRKGWIVNATEFDLVFAMNDGQKLTLPARSFVPHRRMKVWNMQLKVVTFPIFDAEDGTTTSFSIDKHDWKKNVCEIPRHSREIPRPSRDSLGAANCCKVAIESVKALISSIRRIPSFLRTRRKSTESYLYRGKLQGCGQKPMGQIKLVLHRMRRDYSPTLLAIWSPPHIYRGMPLRQFQSYLDTVVEYKGSWEGETSKDRNMYHACKNYIIKEIACFDASYAELQTDYGPPDVFVSHVWGESAFTTKKCLTWLEDVIRHRLEEASLRKSMSKTASSESDLTLLSGSKTTAPMYVNKRLTFSTLDEKATAQIRLNLWFCTCCNNQMRVSEELGDDVDYSPFAQVLRHPSCKLVALISPLKALERKWCNYEFCLAATECQLETMMVTSDGVIQAGQVSPQKLFDLADRLSNFSCAEATCANKDDERLIDLAVARSGGYKVLDSKLMSTFEVAVGNALHWAQQAHHRLSSRSNLAEVVEQENGHTGGKTTIIVEGPPQHLEEMAALEAQVSPRRVIVSLDTGMEPERLKETNAIDIRDVQIIGKDEKEWPLQANGRTTI